MKDESESVTEADAIRTHGNRIRKIYQFGAAFIAVAMISSVLTLVAFADGPSEFETIVMPGSMVEDASYVIFKDSSNVTFAKNGETGEIEFSSANSSSVFQSVNDALPQGGTVFVKQDPDPWIYTDNQDSWYKFEADYYLTHTVTVNQGVSFVSDGVMISTDGRNDTIFHFYNDLTDPIQYSAYWTFSGFTFAGRSIVTDDHATDSGCTAMYVSDAQGKGIVIDEIYAREVANPLVIEGPCYWFQVQHCRFSFGITGILILADDGGGNAGIITDCDISGMMTCGIDQQTGTGIKILNCWLESNTVGINASTTIIQGNFIQPSSNGYGVQCSGGISPIISENIFELGPGVVGVQIISDGLITINDNSFSIAGGNADGINATTSTSIVAIGNTAWMGEPTTNSTFIYGPYAKSIITGNRIAGGNPAINLTGPTSSYNIVSDNRISNFMDGIAYYGYFNLFSGNVFLEDRAGVNAVGINQRGGHSNEILGNSFVSISFPINVSGTAPIIRDNFGYVTQNKGTATITTDTSVIFDHYLATTPTLVLASFNLASYGNYTWTATTTEITITVSTSGTYTVYWYAEV